MRSKPAAKPKLRLPLKSRGQSEASNGAAPWFPGSQSKTVIEGPFAEKVGSGGTLRRPFQQHPPTPKAGHKPPDTPGQRAERRRLLDLDVERAQAWLARMLAELREQERKRRQQAGSSESIAV
jgi:hypothetical protein